MRELPKDGSRKPEKETAAGAWAPFSIGVGVCAANPSLVVTWMAVFTVIHSMQLLDFKIIHGAFFSLGIAAGISFGFMCFCDSLKNTAPVLK